MPEASLLILHGGAVSCAGQESARFVGIRIVFRQFKRSHRGVSHIDTVGIGIVLGAGRRILQVIFPLMLVHPGAFDIRTL